jgi:hypothetical protein
MNLAKNLFLRAAHWQIFTLLAVLYLMDTVVAISLIGAESTSVKNIPLPTLLFLQTTAMVTFAAFFFWLWTMGAFLNSLVKPALRLSLGLFRFALIFPLVYGLAFPFFAWLPRALSIYVIAPIHLFAMACVIYSLRFVAKSLALQEERRFLTFRDYYPSFFLLWFFPIGVWWIQPKVNKLYVARANQEA